jgi:plasmid stabilization system protein ParE
VRRYVLAPAAANDLVQIWRYIQEKRSETMADRVEEVILEKMALLAADPGIGHPRSDLTAADVRFFPVYSYLIVYRPSMAPLQIVAVLHGARDVLALLKKRTSV